MTRAPDRQRRPAWIAARAAALAVALPACLEPLPDAVDFGAALRCPAGELACDGRCVPQDADNCGACGAVCPAGVCEDGACQHCQVSLGDVVSAPVQSKPGATVLELVCPNVRRNGLYRARVFGVANVHNDACRSPEQCIRWTLEVDVGERAEFPGGGCTADAFRGSATAIQTVEDLPAPDDGPIRLRLRGEPSEVAGCEGLATFFLATKLELSRTGSMADVAPAP